MKNEVYFENVPHFGDLFLEKVLFEDECPIFFTLHNVDCTQRFIGVCCDIINEQRWVILTIGEETIINLLLDNITIREAFNDPCATYIVGVWKEEYEKEEYKLCKLSDIPKNDLPSGNVYFKSQKYFEDYISFLYDELAFNYNCHVINIIDNYLNCNWTGTKICNTVSKLVPYTSTLDYNEKENWLKGVSI